MGNPLRASNKFSSSIYITKLVLEWIRDIGGVDELEKRNIVSFIKKVYKFLVQSRPDL